MESYPYYSIDVNIAGTKLLADLSVEYRVKRFINLSSDMAVNPVSLMGASKRIGEMYLEALAQTKNNPTRFVSVRFGQLAVPGSMELQVIEKQIAQGGPVTIPVKNAKFWRTSLEETTRLIIEAGFMGNNGELFSLVLSEPVTYYDLAVSTIAGAGYQPHSQIEIRITGKPEDERLYNEPDYREDTRKLTAHPQIREEKRLSIDYATLNRQINKLLGTLDNQSLNELIEQMMYIVPEYISHNKGFSSGG
jgi:FlaA1/EpsC-like NDP-sugar epimerase